MSRIMMVGCILGISVAMAGSGCNIENCERGAHCMDGSDDGKWDDDADEHDQCLSYCERLSICGAPGARDFDACVEACEDRFEALPEETAELCACTPRSRCEDVIDGRCTDPGSGGRGGSGGTSSTGGSPSEGGSQATGGSSPNGGSSTTGGSSSYGGSSTGGSSTTGGSSSTGGTECAGGSHSTGGSATGGSNPGGAGGEEPGTPCTCSCQCPSGQSCVSGYCG